VVKGFGAKHFFLRLLILVVQGSVTIVC
jgi:hypothetical protein